MPAGNLRYGYVTSGLSEHRLEHALALLADAGYDGVWETVERQSMLVGALGYAVLSARYAALAEMAAKSR